MYVNICTSLYIYSLLLQRCTYSTLGRFFAPATTSGPKKCVRRRPFARVQLMPSAGLLYRASCLLFFKSVCEMRFRSPGKR